MDPSLPVETKDGYKQAGAPIDRDSMLEVLSSKPASADDAKRAKTLAFVSTVLAAAGGALIGYPLGQKLGGEEPNWTLAYVGAGSAVASIPLAIWADSSVGSAVEAHNRSLGAQPDAARSNAGSRRLTNAAPQGLERWGVHLVHDPVCLVATTGPAR